MNAHTKLSPEALALTSGLGVLSWQRLPAFDGMRAEGAFFQAGKACQRSYMITDDRGASDPGPHVYATFCDAGQKAITLGKFTTLDQARTACETHARGGQ